MLDIQIHSGAVEISGSFDMGYMGRYGADQIRLYEDPDLLRCREFVTRALGPDCSDRDLSAFLTEYFNAFEEKIHQNRKQVNDCFLIHVFRDLEACGYPYWEIDGLTRREFLPEDPDEDVYSPHWDEMDALDMACSDTPNDGSLEKPDVEAVLRRNFPSMDWDALLGSIVPEVLTLTGGRRVLSFQCSDGFGEALLCGAYDELDETLAFCEWHNH